VAQVKVRGLDEEVVAALKHRAAIKGRSLEQELREIITASVRPSWAEFLRKAEELRRKYPSKRPQSDSVDLLREDRDR